LNSEIFARRISDSYELTLSLAKLLRHNATIKEGLKLCDISIALLFGRKRKVKGP